MRGRNSFLGRITVAALLAGAVLGGCAGTQGAAAAENLVLELPSPPAGDLFYSVEGTDGYGSRLATQVERWLLGRGGQRPEEREQARILILTLQTRLSQRESSGVMFVGKEYRLELTGDLVDPETGTAVGRLEGVIEEEYSRFVLRDDTADGLYDGWDDRFLRSSAAKIGELLVP